MQRWSSWGSGRGAALAVLAATLAVPLSVSAQHTRDGAYVVRGPLRVPASDVTGSVVSLEGPVRVDGVVVGDAVAVGGDVTVTGTVSGDVVALSGDVRLGPSAQVGGNLVSPREPIVARGAQVRGAVQSIGAVERAGRGLDAVGYVLGWLGMTTAAILLALLLHWLVPRRARDGVLASARREPGKAVGVGLLVAIVLPVIALAAMITIIGIPVGVALFVAAGFLAFVGFVTSGWVLGRYLASRSTRERDPLVWMVIGVGLLCAVALIPVAGSLVWIAAAMYGVGAIALSLYESRRERRPAEPVPTRATPPTPPRHGPPSYGGPPEERPIGV